MPLAVSPTPLSLGSSVTLHWYLPCLCHGEDGKRQLRLSACRDVYFLTTAHKHAKVSTPRTARAVLRPFSNISQPSSTQSWNNLHPLLTSVNDLNSCFGLTFVHSIAVSLQRFSFSSVSHWFLACLIPLLSLPQTPPPQLHQWNDIHHSLSWLFISLLHLLSF